jgi:hypothetical protein
MVRAQQFSQVVDKLVRLIGGLLPNRRNNRLCGVTRMVNDVQPPLIVCRVAKRSAKAKLRLSALTAMDV